VNSVFGANALSIGGTEKSENQIIGAVRAYYETGEFSFFCGNLKNRFTRLRELYSDHPTDYKNILTKIGNLTKPKWAGSYAELAAYDYFGQFTYVETEILGIDKSLTLARYDITGRKCTSFDGRLPEYNLTFQIKSFNDNLRQILKNVEKEVQERNRKVKDLAFSYPQDYDYNSVEKNRRSLISEILNSAERGLVQLNPKSMPEFSVQIHYDRKRIISTTHSYSPFRHARENKYFVLQHFDQLFENDNNLMVYVVHPWMSTVINDFNDKKTFFRSICRRVFCELSKNTDPLNSVMSDKWKHVIYPISDIVRKIGGILFLVDNNVLPSKKADPVAIGTIFEPYLYLNPNANPCNRNIVFTDLLSNNAFRRTLREIDDFAYDNY
jgi:hypothetical protein